MNINTSSTTNVYGKSNIKELQPSTKSPELHFAAPTGKTQDAGGLNTQSFSTAGTFPSKGFDNSLNFDAQLVRGQKTTAAGAVGAASGGVTQQSLINSLRTIRPDIAQEYDNNPAARKKIDEVARASIEVGREQNVDPKILFAMATQESTCGLNPKHSSSAKGVTGMKPTSAPDKGVNLNDPKTCLTQTAKYLKTTLVNELNSKQDKKGHHYYNVSANDLRPGTNNNNTKLLLMAYRFGAGGADTKVHHNVNNAPTSARDYKRVFNHIAAIH